MSGFAFITAGPEEILNYLNFPSKKPLTGAPAYSSVVLFSTGIFSVLSAILLLKGIFSRKLSAPDGTGGLKWGLLAAISGLFLYGFLVRAVSNHAMSATLFFYASVLYFLMWWA